MKKYFNFIDKFQLILSIISYGVGVNFVRYLGFSINWASAMFGIVIILFTIFSSNLLYLYFHLPLIISIDPEKKEKERNVLLFSSIAMMAIIPVILFFLFRDGLVNASLFIIFGLYSILVFGNSIPPFHFQFYGWGELNKSFYVAGIIPALGFLFQNVVLSRALLVFSIPMVLITLASYLVKSFAKYSEDVKYGNRSIVTIFSWQISAKIHNVILVISFLFIALFPFLGIPSVISMPIFFSIPFAIFQVLYMLLIVDGMKPNWKLYLLTSDLTAVIALYFINLSLSLN